MYAICTKQCFVFMGYPFCFKTKIFTKMQKKMYHSLLSINHLNILKYT